MKLICSVLFFILIVSAQTGSKIIDKFNFEDVQLAWEIGGEEAEGDYLLNKVFRFALDEKKSIYLADNSNMVIKKYNSAGRFVKNIGRQGEGPGEFLYLSGLCVSKNELLVYDARRKIFSRFDLEGNFIKSIKIEEPVEKFKVFQNGNILIETLVYNWEDKRGDLNKLVLYNNELNKIKVIDSIRCVSSIASKTLKAWVPVPYAPKMFWNITNEDKIAVAFTQECQLKIYSPSGELILKKNIEDSKVKVSQRDKENFVKNLRLITGEGSFKVKVEQLINELPFPRYKLAFNFFLVTVDNGLLIQTNKTVDEKIVYDLLDAELRFVKQLQIGPGLLNMNSIIKNDELYNLDYNPDEFTKFQKYLIRKN